MWRTRARPAAKARLASLASHAPPAGAHSSQAPGDPGFDSPLAQRSHSPLIDTAGGDNTHDDNDDAPKRGWFLTWDRRSLKAVSVVLAALSVVVAWWWWSGRPSQTVVPAEVSVTGGVPVAGAEQDQQSGIVVVHVVGKVAEPGIVELPAGSRVLDAIDAVGGASSTKALETVNLARIVVDGEQIVVGAAAADSGGGKVSINNADAAALEQLPGVGPVIAERIVAWRTENGPFRSVQELAEISGIGPSMIERIEDQVRM